MIHCCDKCLNPILIYGRLVRTLDLYFNSCHILNYFIYKSRFLVSTSIAWDVVVRKRANPVLAVKSASREWNKRAWPSSLCVLTVDPAMGMTDAVELIFLSGTCRLMLITDTCDSLVNHRRSVLCLV